ncbi:MAG: ABC transporter substrate-binding protein [Gemmatirosa sp.]|nr:ABC transporter substrate-binding protein [Gemmatirosa sp.]
MSRHRGSLVRSLLAIAVAAVAPIATACSSRGAGGGERVVSVSKQINEFLYAIGAEGVLVGRDLTSIYPPQIKQVPSVGYHRALSAEGIISIKPTLLVTDGNVGPEPVLDQVRKVGIPVVTLAPGGTVDSAQALMTKLGQQFHREHAADSVVAAWRAGMDSLWRDTAQWAAPQGQKRPRVLIIHFGQIRNNYLALKRGGPADAMLHWAGAENAVDSVGGMAPLTPELIARAAPDVIIATDVGFDRYGSVDKFKTLPGVALTPAAQANRIHRIDEQEIMYYGPRTAAVVRKLAAWLRADSAATAATTAAQR